MHVVETIGVEPVASLSALEHEAGFHRRAAGGGIQRGVLHFNTMKARALERPPARDAKSSWGDPLATSGRQHPIGRLGPAVVKVQLERHPADEPRLRRDGPAGRNFVCPIRVRFLHPLCRLIVRHRPRMPSLDTRVLIGSADRTDVFTRPWPKRYFV
jgi:hypothetical protein